MRPHCSRTSRSCFLTSTFPVEASVTLSNLLYRELSGELCTMAVVLLPPRAGWKDRERDFRRLRIRITFSDREVLRTLLDRDGHAWHLKNRVLVKYRAVVASLTKLEAAGIIASRWETNSNGVRRRVHRLTRSSRRLLTDDFDEGCKTLQLVLRQRKIDTVESRSRVANWR